MLEGSISLADIISSVGLDVSKPVHPSFCTVKRSLVEGSSSRVGGKSFNFHVFPYFHAFSYQFQLMVFSLFSKGLGVRNEEHTQEQGGLGVTEGQAEGPQGGM